MSDTVILVDSVAKKFCRSLQRSLWYGLQDLGREISGRSHGGDGALRAGEFWAVRDVGFEVRRGECVGLIGHNGAGKTTLLRMLNGLIKPDRGRIEMRGRVGALIALGAGFNPVLTGRENIYVNGALLGLSRREIDARLSDIIEFSGLAEFIDSPVQHYSSGMYVRLGFSVAAHVRPDILLVDEALAVGDVSFVIRCLNKVAELRREGAAILFVSHNELQMRVAASRCLVMSKGTLLGDVDVDSAFVLYDQSRAESAPAGDAGFIHDGPVRMGRCEFEPVAAVAGERLRLQLWCDAREEIAGASVELRVWNAAGQVVASLGSVGRGGPVVLAAGSNRVDVDIPMLPLVSGRYRLAGGFRRDGEFLGWARDLAHFDVQAPASGRVGEGVCYVPADFSVTAVPGMQE